MDTSVVTLRMISGALCQIDSSRRTGYGYDERIEVFGSKGMIESRRQRARGVSRYTGDKVIEDGLHAGWFERIEQVIIAPWTLLRKRSLKALHPVHRLRMASRLS